MTETVETEKEEEVIEEVSTIGDDLRDALAAAEESQEEVKEKPVVETTEEKEIPEKDAAPEEGAEEATGVVAPEHWPTEERETFDALPEEAKPFVLTQGERLHAHHQKRVEELSSEREALNRLTPLDQELAPYREQLKLQGVNEADVVKQLMAVRTSLQTAPVETIKWLAQSYGVNLDNLNDETLVDPTETRLNAVEQQVQNVQQTNTQAIQKQSYDIARQSAQTQIDTFAEAKNEDGTLKHPHYEDVLETMTTITRADHAEGKAVELDDVYQRACWMHESTRGKLLSERDTSREADVLAKEKKNQRQRTSRARRADTTIRSSADTPAQSKLSIRDELSQNWDSAAN